MSKQRLTAAVHRAAKHIAKRVREQGLAKTDLLTVPRVRGLIQSLTMALASDYPLHAEGLQGRLLQDTYNRLEWDIPLSETEDG